MILSNIKRNNKKTSSTSILLLIVGIFLFLFASQFILIKKTYAFGGFNMPSFTNTSFNFAGTQMPSFSTDIGHLAASVGQQLLLGCKGSSTYYQQVLCKVFVNCQNGPLVAGLALPEGFDPNNPDITLFEADPRSLDVCINRVGVQTRIPTGFVDVGGKLCQLGSNFQSFCRALKNPVLPGTRVTFVATPFNQAEGEVLFNWIDTTTDRNIKTELSLDRSTVSYRFDTVGIHTLAVTATDSSGTSNNSVCGVTVTNDVEAVEDAEKNFGFDGPEPEISLTGGGFTNSTCPAEWTTEHVSECWLVSESGSSEKVEIEGGVNSGRVIPGIYRLRCIATSEKTQILETDPIVCRDNIDFREI